MKPLITIVVCTYNRAGMLRDAVASLLPLQTADRFDYEVLVVDNASTDDTAKVIEQLAAESPKIRGVFESRKGVAAARNRGVAEARGEWIAFFDDDQLADPKWLMELFDFATQRNLKAVGGAVHLLLPEGCQRDLHPFVRMLLGESRWSDTPFPYSPKVAPGTGNLMVHRTVFDDVGTFNEALQRAEDTDFFCRMWSRGYEAWYIPAAIVHHITPDERLQENYLQRLASGMGKHVAHKERSLRSPCSFLVRWMAKSLLIPAVTRLKLAKAAWAKDAEAELGLRLSLDLATAYRGEGCTLVSQDLAKWLPSRGFRLKKPSPAV